MFHWVSFYDFDFLVASIPVQIILIAFYCSRRNLPLRSNRSFLIAMIANLVMTISDIFACEMLAEWTKYSEGSLYLINMVYFLTYLIRSWALFDYTAQETHIFLSRGRIYNLLTAIPLIVASAIIIIAPWNGLLFSITADRGYSGGPAYSIIYIISYFYIAISILCVLLRWKDLSYRMSISMISFNILLIIGTLLRNRFMHVLIMPYFSILAILVIYLAAQNPDFFIDRNVHIFNHDAFDKIISQYRSENKSFTCIAVTIDNYEAAKALYGNQQLLTSLILIGRWIIARLKGYNVFYLGNGGYLLLHEGDDGSYEETLETIRDRFTFPWIEEDTEVYLTISMLVMPADITDQKRHDLHDVIMYCFSLASIENNRGNYILNQNMLKDMSRFADVESAIGRALEEHRMEFHLQPIVDSISGRTIGAEALARLNDPDLGFIPPNEFIMVAEKTGDIMEMGRQLFNKICEFLADTDIKKYGLKNINVNLSPVQCMNSKLASELSGIADRHNVSLDLIDFEITETAIEDNDQIHDQIVRLQNKGALISLDDFGMGTSNLTRLMQFPIHVVKLDLNVVRSFFNGESSVLPDLIRMFHNSGMKVVAEGVETEEMKDGLMQMGCEYEQGYYFSKPVPPNDFIEYLEREA